MRLVFLNTKNVRKGSLDVRSGKPVASGCGADAANLKVLEPKTFRVLTPEDGDEWLRGVRYCFRSPFLRAVMVDSDGEG